jgi:diaminobutyrate-2-oxoglutarate transaminase
MPMLFDGDLGPNVDTIGYLNAFLDNPENGLGMPAAVIVETIQAEGGVRVASNGWLRRLEEATRRRGVLLIVDDIQTGCGRTGDFFSFEEADIKPDIVCLSKSIGGYGLPMSLVLIRREVDLWEPGEHTGTFRGNNLAFVTAAAALEYWRDDSFSKSIAAKSRAAAAALQSVLENDLEGKGDVRGRGLMQGLVFTEPGLAQEVSHAAFERGVIVETCGPRDEVLKLLPPLTITSEELERGISIISKSVRAMKSGAKVHVAP